MSEFFNQFLQQMSHYAGLVWVGSTVAVLVYVIFFLAKVIERFLPGHDPEAVMIFKHHRLFWKSTAIAYIVGGGIFFVGIFLPILVIVLLFLPLVILKRLKGKLIPKL